jgi:hypothetical protein
MRIKVTSLAIFHKKEAYATKKRERIKEQKALVFKERVKKVVMPSQKKLEKGNFSKEYHFHQIYNTHAHLDQLV